MNRAVVLKAAFSLLVVAALVAGFSVSSADAQIKWGPYFKKHKAKDTIEASIERGRKFYNKVGCGGCHPRGGTIGGTAVNAAGFRVPFAIPPVKGAATHFPRFATKRGILVNLGQMNDL